jgi:hypothetical protein
MSQFAGFGVEDGTTRTNTTSSTTMELKLELDSLQLGGEVRRREAGWKLKEMEEAAATVGPTGGGGVEGAHGGGGAGEGTLVPPCNPSEDDMGPCKAFFFNQPNLNISNIILSNQMNKTTMASQI